jgi:hypothetical protein
MTTLITLVLPIGGDAGPFNLYSNVGGYAIPFETNISASALQAGYTSYVVPNGTTIIRVTSVGVCTNSIDITVGLTPTTTTTSSSSSSTSTTTSTAVPTTTTTSSSSTSTSTSTTLAPTTTTTTTEEGPTACNCQTVTWVNPGTPTWTGITNFKYRNCEGVLTDGSTNELGPNNVCAQDGSIVITPAPDGDGSATYDLSEIDCCASLTTTTTTAAVQNINYRVTACPNAGIYAGFSYNFPKNGTTHSIGDVVQFIIPGDVDGLVRCGTITSITYPNNAIDASLFGINTYDCDDVAHCNV